MGYGQINSTTLRQAEARAARSPQPRRSAEPTKNHPLLDLSKVRKSMVTEQHPDPRAIALGLDVTGSTQQAHREMITGGTTHFLDVLLSLGAQGGFTPQVMFAGLTDIYDPCGALQVGHFESDNRMYDQLRQITVDGGSGPYQHHEAGYLYFLFFLAFKTEPECFTRLGKKAHAILVGDEFPHESISVEEAKKFGVSIQRELSFAEVLAKVRVMYHVTFISLQTSTGIYGRTTQHWHQLLGVANVIETDGNGTGLAQDMTILIGMREGLMTAQRAVEHLVDIGVDKPTVLAVAKTFGVDTGTLFPEDAKSRQVGGFSRE